MTFTENIWGMQNLFCFFIQHSIGDRFKEDV